MTDDPAVDALDTLEELKDAIVKLAEQRDHYARILHHELRTRAGRPTLTVGDKVRIDDAEQTWTVGKVYRDSTGRRYHLEGWPDVSEDIPEQRITACVFE